MLKAFMARSEKLYTNVGDSSILAYKIENIVHE